MIERQIIRLCVAFLPVAVLCIPAGKAEILHVDARTASGPAAASRRQFRRL